MDRKLIDEECQMTKKKSTQKVVQPHKQLKK